MRVRARARARAIRADAERAAEQGRRDSAYCRAPRAFPGFSAQSRESWHLAHWDMRYASLMLCTYVQGRPARARTRARARARNDWPYKIIDRI